MELHRLGRVAVLLEHILRATACRIRVDLGPPDGFRARLLLSEQCAFVQILQKS